MKQALENAFPQVIKGGCLETETRSLFHIYDSDLDPRRCHISHLETDDVHFTVNNPNNVDIHFLAIDKCIFDDLGPSRCDFALFSNSVFCFVEIKDVKMRGRQKARVNAQKQLSSTISEFLEQGVIFHNLNLEAIICFVHYELYPAITATSIDAVVEFQDQFNARLLIGNSRTF